MPLKSQLESLLFVSLKPLSLKDLAAAVRGEADEVEEALNSLIADYGSGERGLTIVKNNGQYQLATAPDNAALIQEFLKDESTGELSQASLEALTIIAYRGPITKLELERIRGVNCSLIIRNLLMRGLVEENFDKVRQENYYAVTHDFVRFLGLGSIEELPEFAKLHAAASLDEAMAADNDKN